MNKITTYYSVMHSETLSAGIYVTLTLTPTQMLLQTKHSPTSTAYNSAQGT